MLTTALAPLKIHAYIGQYFGLPYFWDEQKSQLVTNKKYLGRHQFFTVFNAIYVTSHLAVAIFGDYNPKDILPTIVISLTCWTAIVLMWDLEISELPARLCNCMLEYERKHGFDKGKSNFFKGY